MSMNETEFMQALADQLKTNGVKAKFIPNGENEYEHIDCALGLRLVCRHGVGSAGKGRFTVSAYTRIGGNLHYSERKPLPTCSVKGDRPMEAIAKDVQNKVIKYARPKIEELQQKVSAVDDSIATLKTLAESLMARIKGLSVNIDRDQRTARVYINSGSTTGGAYMNGTLYPDGKLSVERIALDQSKTESLLRLLAE